MRFDYPYPSTGVRFPLQLGRKLISSRLLNCGELWSLFNCGYQDFNEIVKHKYCRAILANACGCKNKSVWREILRISVVNDKGAVGGDGGKPEPEALARVSAFYGYRPADITDMTLHDFYYLVANINVLIRQNMAMQSASAHSVIEFPTSDIAVVSTIKSLDLSDAQREFLAKAIGGTA